MCWTPHGQGSMLGYEWRKLTKSRGSGRHTSSIQTKVSNAYDIWGTCSVYSFASLQTTWVLRRVSKCLSGSRAGREADKPHNTPNMVRLWGFLGTLTAVSRSFTVIRKHVYPWANSCPEFCGLIFSLETIIQRNSARIYWKLFCALYTKYAV